MTIQDGRTSTGTDTQTYVAIADTLGADIIGVNCSDGPEGMYETAKLIVNNTNKPICLQPNAGLPKIVGKEVGLHFVWVLMSIIIFGKLFGFWGLLVAIPTAAGFKMYVKDLIIYYKNSPFYKKE